MRTRSGQKYIDGEAPERPQPTAQPKPKTPKQSAVKVSKETTGKKKKQSDAESAPKRSRRGVAFEETPLDVTQSPKRETRNTRSRQPVAEDSVKSVRKTPKSRTKSDKTSEELAEQVAEEIEVKPSESEAKKEPKGKSERKTRQKPNEEEKSAEVEDKETQNVEQKPKTKAVPKRAPKRGAKRGAKPVEETDKEPEKEPKVSGDVMPESVDEIVTEPEVPAIEDKSEEKPEEEQQMPQESSLKRKDGESEADSQSTKRQRLSRFDVPSVSRISGQLFSFGDEIAGELGLRQKRVKEVKVKDNEPSPVTDKDNRPLDNVVAVVCGAMHSCCLTEEGKVWTFGCNDDSALGRDTQTSPDATDDSIDVDDSEEAECRTPRPVAGLPEVVKVSAGDMHTCVLSKDGAVFVWGNFKDESKKLGLFADALKCESSDDFSATAAPRQLAVDCKVVDIASGCHHVLLLTEDGRVLSCGEGTKGQLGRISTDDLQTIATNRPLFLEPREVPFGADVVVETVWANHWSSFAKSTAGDVYVWGLNNYHQLGFKSDGFVEIVNCDANESQTSLKLIVELRPIKCPAMPPNVRQIANGQHHMLALDADGRVFSCGCNTYSKLGYKTDTQDPTVDSPRLIPTAAFDHQKVSFITCGEFCSLAVTESGHVYGWGQGSKHIGSKAFADVEAPTKVAGVVTDSTNFLAVSSGSQHSLLIGFERAVNGN